jgi:prefoldin subunit 5
MSDRVEILKEIERVDDTIRQLESVYVFKAKDQSTHIIESALREYNRIRNQLNDQLRPWF